MSQWSLGPGDQIYQPELKSDLISRSQKDLTDFNVKSDLISRSQEDLIDFVLQSFVYESSE